METKHTKGEWTIEVQSKTQDAIVGADSCIAMIPKFHKDAEANAKLIASAPDLLEALTEAKRELMNHIMSLKNESIFMKINNAIDKATK